MAGSWDVGVAGDYTTLQLWADSEQGGAGALDITIISDIEGETVIDASAAGSTLRIHGDLTSGLAKRVLSSSVAGSTFFYINNLTNTMNIVMEDLEFDADAQTSGVVCHFQNGCGTATVERCYIHGGRSHLIESRNEITSFIVKNCILESSQIGSGINITQPTAACAVTIRNNTVNDNGSIGFLWNNSSNFTINCHNNIVLNSGVRDYQEQTPPVVNLFSCISSDATANSASHDITDDCVDSVSGATIDAALTGVGDGNGAIDYAPLKDSVGAWGTTSDGTNTPTLDFAGVTRINKTIGALEFISPPSAGGSASEVAASGPRARRLLGLLR